MANFETAVYYAIVVQCTCASVVSGQFLLTPNYDSTFENYGSFYAPTVKCDATAKYRSINGSCNNLKIPWLGAYKTPHLRILNAYYNDGVYEFRKQIDNSSLPSAREIQLQMFLFKQIPSWDDRNVLFVLWGQFIAHDTTHLPPDLSAGKDCCVLQTKFPVPPQCRAVIDVPKNDPVFLGRGQTCIDFKRATTSATDGCPLTPTSFMVHATHFLDGSHIYGSDDEMATNLRSFLEGRLKSDYYGGRQEFCPQTNRSTWKCDSSKRSAFCYAAGDQRVNQNLGIALFQNMFLRFHNIVAFHLSRMNPFWTDEIVYQETRMIVIAVIQHITYTYYLPILLGEKFTVLNGFHQQTVYDESVNPSTAIEFSTGALRTLHKQIPPVYNFIDENHVDFHRVLLTDWIDRPDLLPMSNNFDALLRGFQETPTRGDQPSYNPLISNFLFQQTTPKFKGDDLLTKDIQRSRDTGLPPYNKMRSVCGIPEAKTFDDLIDLIAFENVQKLKELYYSVDDIDFIVGALMEVNAEGAKVGPTARCVIADNFYRFKTGDRFFYDVQNQPGSLTPEQLQTIQNTNLGHVICATSNIQHLPADIFMPSNNGLNTRQYDCNVFELNLIAWKDYYYFNQPHNMDMLVVQNRRTNYITAPFDALTCISQVEASSEYVLEQTTVTLIQKL